MHAKGAKNITDSGEVYGKYGKPIKYAKILCR